MHAVKSGTRNPGGPTAAKRAAREEGEELTLARHAVGESDEVIVVRKPANKPGHRPEAEQAERRASAERNPCPDAVTGTQRPEGTDDGLQRIRAAARGRRTERFNNLFHHITVDLLRRAYQGLERKAAPGVDGVDWHEYGLDLEGNLERLHERVHQGRYRPQPVKRTWIDKADGGQRPLGITCVEDKIVQQALVWVLEAIYEQDFLGFSYGFRPGRGPHNGLDALYMAITVKKVSFVLDADIRSYFDTVDRAWLGRFMEHRIADRRILKLIEHTLNAGTMDDGQWQDSGRGIPQGAVLSPLLANIYLHYSFDQWAHQWRKRHARGEVYLVRYADDVVACFQYQDDAQAFREALAERLARFGLELHPVKTRLIEFGRFARSNRQRRGLGKPETFEFLGFTHVCARRRSDGKFTVHRYTIARRQCAKLKEIRRKLMRKRFLPVACQGRWLARIIQGVVNYFGVPGNRHALDGFRTEICKSWYRALRRRSQKSMKLPWATMTKIIKRWIPSVRVVHPYPNARLCV